MTEKLPIIRVTSEQSVTAQKNYASFPTTALDEGCDVVIEQVPSTDMVDEANNDLANGQIVDPDRHKNVTTFHCHARQRPREEFTQTNTRARRTLLLTTGICITFMIAEIVGGLLANSLAIITDAAHLLTDVAGFLISLFALYLATMNPTRRMNYGFHRAEMMGALASVLTIWVITGVLVYLAVMRIINDDYDINAEIMLITASIGVLVNILMAVVLKFCGGGHGHSHGGMSHSHAPARPVSANSVESGDVPEKHGVNINVRAAFIHVLGDFCQSVGVLIAATIIFIVGEKAKIADPICTFIFSILVLITTITILRDVLNVLMEGTPRGIVFNEVQVHLEEIDGVVKVHNLRIWSLSMDKVAVSAHLSIESTMQSQVVLKQASMMLERKFGVFESTIQIEQYEEALESDCHGCSAPKK